MMTFTVGRLTLLRSTRDASTALRPRMRLSGASLRMGALKPGAGLGSWSGCDASDTDESSPCYELSAKKKFTVLRGRAGNFTQEHPDKTRAPRNGARRWEPKPEESAAFGALRDHEAHIRV